jgi:hypothetical protein
LIAATALEHKLTVVTRNGADFQRSEVNTLNPFSESSTANAFPAEDALSVVRTRLQGISTAAGVCFESLPVEVITSHPCVSTPRPTASACRPRSQWVVRKKRPKFRSSIRPQIAQMARMQFPAPLETDADRRACFGTRRVVGKGQQSDHAEIAVHW